MWGRGGHRSSRDRRSAAGGGGSRKSNPMTSSTPSAFSCTAARAQPMQMIVEDIYIAFAAAAAHQMQQESLRQCNVQAVPEIGKLPNRTRTAATLSL